MLEMEIDKDENRYWYNENNQFHRVGGPAVEYANGFKAWYINGKKHRVDGPAVDGGGIGAREWWVNGLCHREKAPAVEWFDGTKEWYLNGSKLICQLPEAYRRLSRPSSPIIAKASTTCS